MTDRELRLAAARRTLAYAREQGHQTGSPAQRTMFYQAVQLVAQLEKDLEGEVAPA